MITLFDMYVEFFSDLQSRWLDFLAPIINRGAVLTTIFLTLLIILFFILRHEYKTYQEIWMYQGLELVFSIFLALGLTMIFYSLMCTIAICLGWGLLLGVVYLLQFLVKFSVDRKIKSE